ncbi:MAG: ammonia channel protein, partial [Verrucomicrobia bacterium]|nr:ammonia channel protein [Verrucomicrobiota bacterium]
MRVLATTLIAGFLMWTGTQLNAAEDATTVIEQAVESIESATETPVIDTGDTA